MKPFLKWVGGKSRLLDKLRPLLPEGVEKLAYVEPFLGSGAMFFDLNPKWAYLSDVNPHLIQAYRDVASYPQEVWDALCGWRSSHERDPEGTYATAKANPSMLGAFIYLNRTCFNGLWRTNKKGELNVPMGKYPAERITGTWAQLAEAHERLKWVEIQCGSVFNLRFAADSPLSKAFVYLDPPYDGTFTGYAAGGFGKKEQEDLADLFWYWSRLGQKLMLSNSDTPLIRELYKDFSITEIEARCSVAAKGSSRGARKELVIRNY